MVLDIYLEVRQVTIRKQLSLIMLLLIIVSVIVNSLISTNYIDRYFKNYVSEQYDTNMKAIVTFSTNILLDGVENRLSAETELENFLNDPIVALAIYDGNGKRVAFAEDSMYNMHRGMMMGGMYDVENDTLVLSNGSREIGQLVITRNAEVQSSETVRLFKIAMLMGTLISTGIVLLLSLALISLSSKRITRDLRETARFARSIELGENEQPSGSKTFEIKALQLSLENLSNKLKLQKAARKQKTDQLAHETRTPLTILRTNLEGALDEVVEMDEVRLGTCLNEIENLSALIANMNEVIEYESYEAEIVLNNYDLVKEIKKVMKGLNIQFKNKGIALNYDGPNSYFVTQDSSLINQALYNLLTNAYKFTENGGVLVALEVRNDSDWSLSVKDTGFGIEQDDINRIFDAYYRSPKATSTDGDGLGLYITKASIDRLGGEIKVESRLDKGTSFTIYFKEKDKN